MLGRGLTSALAVAACDATSVSLPLPCPGGTRPSGPVPTCSCVSLAASFWYCGRLASFSSADRARRQPGGRSRPARRGKQAACVMGGKHEEGSGMPWSPRAARLATSYHGRLPEHVARACLQAWPGGPASPRATSSRWSCQVPTPCRLRLEERDSSGRRKVQPAVCLHPRLCDVSVFLLCDAEPYTSHTTHACTHAPIMSASVSRPGMRTTWERRRGGGVALSAKRRCAGQRRRRTQCRCGSACRPASPCHHPAGWRAPRRVRLCRDRSKTNAAGGVCVWWVGGGGGWGVGGSLRALAPPRVPPPRCACCS